MIAELKGKISSSGSNLTERSEDQLTGDFFGALRYVSFNRVLKRILERSTIFNRYELKMRDCISKIDMEYWADHIRFWPYNALGEFDIILDFPSMIIGIEVKLYSGLSSDDGVNIHEEELEVFSINQLSRESRILKQKSIEENRPALLLFVAPEDKCYKICNDVYERNLIQDEVGFGYLSWEEMLESMKQILLIEQLNEYEKLIISDLLSLLQRKGLERFKSFNFQCKDIDNELWYKFESKMDFNFDVAYDKMVNRERYYEFR